MLEAKLVPSVPTARAVGAARLAAAALAAAALASAGHAQTMNNSGSGFNAGYGRGGSSFNTGIDVGTRDENQNSVFINGILQAPAGSVFSRAGGFSQSTSSGVGGQGMATAIGNNLQVIVQGSYNRVTVDSTQINNGDVSANANLNGLVNLDGP